MGVFGDVWISVSNASLEGNHLDLLLAWACGLLLFLMSLVYMFRRACSEVVTARRAVKLTRVGCALLLLLQLPLLAVPGGLGSPVTDPYTGYGDGGSFNFGWARPVSELLFTAMGLFVNSHMCFRWLFGLGQPGMMVADTFSEVDLHAEHACRAEGKCPSEDAYSQSALEILKMRDLAALALEMWMWLLAGYLCVSLGFFRQRYAYSSLHTGHFNRRRVMREALWKHGLHRKKNDDDARSAKRQHSEGVPLLNLDSAKSYQVAAQDVQGGEEKKEADELAAADGGVEERKTGDVEEGLLLDLREGGADRSGEQVRRR